MSAAANQSARRGPVGVAVIGAGNISKQYLDNLTVFPDLKVHVIADLFEEAAEALNVSRATAKRDWALARAWLFRELQDKSL